MAVVQIKMLNGSYISASQEPIECPYCHTRIVPRYLVCDDRIVFAKCPNSKCDKHLLLLMDLYNSCTTIQPTYAPAIKQFSEIIKTISPEFESIYNQAYYAEQVGLDQICGVGYRKSLEFLIKDYLISNIEDEAEIEIIKNKFLGNCIQEDVVDANIKNVAKRAVWLGNDETHYVRKWLDKDVTNLKQLIDLTVRWIENEVETRRIVEEMN